jgi:hypothetical protein
MAVGQRPGLQDRAPSARPEICPAPLGRGRSVRSATEVAASMRGGGMDTGDDLSIDGFAGRAVIGDPGITRRGGR